MQFYVYASRLKQESKLGKKYRYFIILNLDYFGASYNIHFRIIKKKMKTTFIVKRK